MKHITAQNVALYPIFLAVSPMLVMLYFQGVQFGFLSGGNLLKIYLAALAFSFCELKIRTPKTIPEYCLIALMLSNILVISSNIDMRDILISTILTVTFIVFVTFGYYKPTQAKAFMLSISAVTCVYYTPFMTGIIESQTFGFNTEMFGGNQIVGIANFEHPHIFGITFASISLYLFSNFFTREKSAKHKLITVSLLLISTVAVYQSFARTAWLIYLCGLAMILAQERKNISTKNIAFTVTFIAIALPISNINFEVISNRIFDQYQGTQLSDENRLGSGRFLFWSTYLNHFYQMTPLQMFFGIGELEALNWTEASIGRRLEAHSGILDQIVQRGIVGLLLTLLMIFSILKFGLKTNHLKNRLLPFVLCYIVIFLVQGGYFFFLEMFLYIQLGIAIRDLERLKNETS